MAEVILTHQFPPIPTRDNDWGAYFDGREEDGIKGWGSTKLKAALDLWNYCETPEETLACIVAILRAELEDHGPYWSNPSLRNGFEMAIFTVEGIA